MFFNIGVLKIFCNIHRETPVLESLLNKVAGLKALKPATLFHVNIAEFLRTAFFIEHRRWQLLAHTKIAMQIPQP